MSPVKTDPGNLPIVLLTASDAVVPALIAARGRHAGRRFVEFFTANIRNPNTRKAYYRAACEFFDWCDQARLVELLDIEPVHIAAWVEDIGRRFAPPTVKQWLAAVRMLFDWLEARSDQKSDVHNACAEVIQAAAKRLSSTSFMIDKRGRVRRRRIHD